MGPKPKPFETISSTYETPLLLAALIPHLRPKAGDCLITRLGLEYGERCLNNPLLKIEDKSGFTWSKKEGCRKGFMGGFSVLSRETNLPLLSIQKKGLSGIEWNRYYSNKLRKELFDIFTVRTDKSVPGRVETLTVLGGLLKTILNSTEYIVSLKTESGITILLKEHPRRDRFIEIYLGGCFNVNPAS